VVGRGLPNENAAPQPGLSIQFHWNPDEYLALMEAEVPDYERLQEELVAATRGMDARSILDLGTGTGETARRVLAAHPRARLTGIDSSEAMLDVARNSLDRTRASFLVGGLEDPLPAGPFDLCVSALTVHHLDGPRKADLFERLSAVLSPGGHFVLADVVVPDDPADAVTPLSPEYDLPSSVGEHLTWLDAAGFSAEVTWRHRDLAVMRGVRLVR
jgi:tRNA (cmo5U34)-methyltransferase